MTSGVCPRCGCRGYVERKRSGSRVYMYYVHDRYEDGKRKRRRCYLGADRYSYVEQFNPLGLSGLADKDRFARYMRKLVEQLTPEQLEILVEIVREKLERYGRGGG